jgi:hypothetical protein
MGRYPVALRNNLQSEARELLSVTDVDCVTYSDALACSRSGVVTEYKRFSRRGVLKRFSCFYAFVILPDAMLTLHKR